MKARLRSGDVGATAAVLDVVAARLRDRYPETNNERSFRAIRSRDVLVNPEADPAIRPLAMAVIALGLLVLAIAAGNVASVLAARTAARNRELAVRLSIGATRGQLMRLLASEAVLLGLVAFALGLLLSRGALTLLESWRPSLPVPLGWTFAIDGRVVLFAATASLMTIVAVVVLPVRRAWRMDPLAILRGHTTGKGMIGRERLLNPQIALSLVLLVVAGLFTRSLQSAASLDLGFRPAGTSVIALNPALSGYDAARARRFWDALVTQIESAPGVRAAALTDRIPLDLYGSLSLSARSESSDREESMQAAHVGARYFEVLRIPVVSGRSFVDLDSVSDRRVAIVSRAAARYFWGDENPLGRQLRLGSAQDRHEIVGMVGDVQLLETLGEEDSPMIYLPLRTGHAGLLRVVAASADDRPLTQHLLTSARAVDPEIAVFEVRGLDQHVSTMLLPFRAAAGVALAAGVFGLLLTIAGTGAGVGTIAGVAYA